MCFPLFVLYISSCLLTFDLVKTGTHQFAVESFCDSHIGAKLGFCKKVSPRAKKKI